MKMKYLHPKLPLQTIFLLRRLSLQNYSTPLYRGRPNCRAELIKIQSKTFSSQKETKNLFFLRNYYSLVPNMEASGSMVMLKGFEQTFFSGVSPFQSTKGSNRLTTLSHPKH
jgi:hypothetical protein